MANKIKRKNFQFSDRDRLAVRLYFVYGSKIEAYRFSRTSDVEIDQNSMYSASQRYFGSEKIQVLMELEKKKLQEGINKYLQRIGLKDEVCELTESNNINTVENIKNIDKDQAIGIITNIINNNKTDSKTVKELIPRLMELKNWKNETPVSESNITFYLPEKK